MFISNIHSTSLNFSSRNKEIRDADKIMRNATQNYPMVSTSRLPYYSIYEKNSDIVDVKSHNTEEKIHQLRAEINSSDTIDYVKQSIEKTKKYKVGNCSEMTDLMATALLTNGYKDVRDVVLYKHSKDSLARAVDHEFLLVNAGEHAHIKDLQTIDKHAFIVDPWLGFVDYVPEAILKYKEFFPECHDIKDKNGNLVKSNLYFLVNTDYRDLKNRTYRQLTRKYPELVVKNDKQHKKFLGLF